LLIRYLKIRTKKTLFFKIEPVHPTFLNPLKKFSCLILPLCFVATACVKKPRIQNSSQKSVDIPITDIRSQQGSNLCWSYGLLALIESRYKIATGRSADFSEEAVGFYKTAEHYLSIYNTYMKQPPESRKKFFENFNLPETATSIQLGIISGTPNTTWTSEKIVAKYGLVPESSFKKKIKTIEETHADFFDLNKKMYELFVQEKALKIEDIFEKMVGTRAFPKRPPRTVEFNGRFISPQEVLLEIGFNHREYILAKTNSTEEFDLMVDIMKTSLAAGYVVPLSLSVDQDRYDTEKMKWFGTFYDNLNPSELHYIVAVDFVNVGGKAGALSGPELEIEMKKHSRLLDYFLIKNSWGESGLSKLPKDFLLRNTFSTGKGVSFYVPRKFVPGAPPL
jgi:hypothetical protein